MNNRSEDVEMFLRSTAETRRSHSNIERNEPEEGGIRKMRMRFWKLNEPFQPHIHSLIRTLVRIVRDPSFLSGSEG